MLVYVAWFSALTNAACLTFLRRYLYQHPMERTCRLMGMAVLVGLLVAAHIPTMSLLQDPGLMDFASSIPNAARAFHASTYAVCGFDTSMLMSPGGQASAIISIILLLGAFIIRVALLHRVFARGVLGSTRRRLSQWTQGKLTALWETCQLHKWWSLHLRLLVYHPLLAMFLYCRVHADLFTSRFFEVSQLFSLASTADQL